MGAREGTVVTLGMFDGMHIGHRELIARSVKIAKEHGWDTAVYTFINHPMSVFAQTPPLLNTAEERVSLMREMGVDRVDMVLFDRAMAQMSPDEFVETLKARYTLRAVVAGFNYTFGYLGQGNAQTLEQYARRDGFLISIVPPVSYDGSEVSSSRIRTLIRQGDMENAHRLLGMPYRLTGTIVKNRHIGTQLGFPTANLEVNPDKLLPRHGVYATRTWIDGMHFASVTNVGNNPTVNGDRVTVETYLLDFAGDIYGKDMSVEFLSFIRPETKFDSPAALSEQIGRDVAFARSVLEQ